MQTPGSIMAINEVEDAAVFEIANFGMVRDLREVLPADDRGDPPPQSIAIYLPHSDDMRQTVSYAGIMKPLRWSEEKNRLLTSKRGVSFEDIKTAIEGQRTLADYPHPRPDSYPNQRILVIEIDEYAYVVPYVDDADHIFLKTAFPSRKETQDRLRGQRP